MSEQDKKIITLGVLRKFKDDYDTKITTPIKNNVKALEYVINNSNRLNYTGEIITNSNSVVGDIKNVTVSGNTRYKKSDGTYTDTWESGVTLESVGETEKNSEGKYPINIESDGGKNLYVGTKDFSSQNLWTGYSFWSKETEKYKDLTVMSYSFEWNGMGQYKSVHIGETYTLSAYVKADSATKVCFFDNNHGVTYSNKNNTVFSVGTEWQRIGVSFTIIKDGTTYFRFENINKVKLYLCGVKLEKGLKNKVPEWNDELSLVDKRTVLLNKPLCRYNDTYKDTIGINNGQIVRNCGVVIFDGSSDENWTYAGNNIFALPFTSYKKVDLTTNSLLMCDKFTVTSHNVLNNISGNYIAFESSYTTDNYIKIRKPDTTDLATFKTWLASNPVSIVYALATPTTEDIQVSPTDNPLQSYNGSTTLTLNNTIKGNISADIPTNVNAIITQQASAIASLQDTVLQTQSALIENEYNNLI